MILLNKLRRGREVTRSRIGRIRELEGGRDRENEIERETEREREGEKERGRGKTERNKWNHFVK